MFKSPLKVGASVLAIAVAQLSHAGTAPYFNPLTQSSAVASPNHINELNSPWQVPAGLSQNNLMSMQEVEADVTQSIQRVNAGRNSSMFDMIAYDPSGRYLFIPHETPFGAGLSRYDIEQDINALIFAGDQGASLTNECDADPEEPRDPTTACPAWDYDFAAFDPARYTPNDTVIVAEEWSGLGRVVEILDPMATPADPTATALTEGNDYRILDSIAKVSHEGINFSEKYANKVIYFIDEWNSGSIYALVLKEEGNYALGGQTFVLSVDAFAATGGDASAYWNEQGENVERFGPATWVPLTDEDGNALPGVTNPFRNGPTNDPRSNDDTRGGRVAADDVGATPYGRPEDMEIGTLPNGNEVLYITTTSEAAVISVEILPGMKAMVRQFASEANTPKNLGFPATTGILNSPDNLAQDALGNIYIIEDAPNSGSVGGDIWFARDMDNDGVAESLDHFMSIQVNGSEATGMIFNPAEPTKFVVAVQHPSSTDLASIPDGFGDAVWQFDLSDIVPPTCDEANDRFGHMYNWKKRSWIKTCSHDYDTNFVKMLERAGSPKRYGKKKWKHKKEHKDKH
ncbi:alkaline phosphatase PhoX [Aurantivibrio plasticivorans]